ncbi:cyclic nucleotide-binding domain-containing protein [Egicoccus sp. AB-alg6-2]|uniref:cyclic nucleotide-binding domain-containing protein n=1 Tax=Egicoccus sp. AB-alg6-2 TaxID=3242692 RepID=UPI00359D2CC8
MGEATGVEGTGTGTRVESSALVLSWIPSESMPPVVRAAFDLGLAHFDPPPPEVVTDLDALQAQNAFRFANRLSAWIEVRDGRIVDHGYDGTFHMGVTTLSFGKRDVSFAAVEHPIEQPAPQVTETSVRFLQTVGCRTGVPMPRPVKRKPYVQVVAPPVWTTLALTLHADGRAEQEIVQASPFPRHWLYDGEGRLVAKTGVLGLLEFAGETLTGETPWGTGDDRAPVLVPAESALERRLSETVMRGGKEPAFRTLKPQETLVEQGEPGDALFLLLDGLLMVEVDGEPVAELGPGAILGERAVLEGERRTATLRATTRAKVAVVAADQVERAALAELSEGHRREEHRSS